MSTILDNQINYTAGGVVWTFDTPFSQPPVVSVGVQLRTGGLVDSIYPLSHKITNLTATSVVIKVYKVILTDLSELLFSECADNDVVVHIMVEGV